MKLEHIALNISDEAEIENFYVTILRMSVERSFVLQRNLSEKIFNVSKEINVFLLKKDSLVFELFLHDQIKTETFSHVCLSFENRMAVLQEAEKQSYESIKIGRENSDIIFISDKAGNKFEIK